MEFDEHVFVAYVDGSLDQNSGKASWGLVIYQGERLIHEDSGLVDYTTLPSDARQSRQVAGELVAAMKAVEWAEEADTKVALVYDFTGIYKWPSGQWKAKKELTQHYRDFMIKHKDCIDSWKWVKSHDGVRGNERADALAKGAIKK